MAISVLRDFLLGYLCYGLINVVPQLKSPPDNVFDPDRPVKGLYARIRAVESNSGTQISCLFKNVQ
ncbi:hypothetical protein COCC4DRAFT_61404 [Bipolaris maydis ATCC 48331]|uniref:Uncharacterized protein n=2 Tax=Cochliobolus heterostrophus TaxID=5016 RepID=N4XDZ1_COCH4|nr:uncharacterized protein COCC4DRAFT_61404 [Bipolaris maydis ATCC 48331]ENI04791.1 hypothetical protein COCC4DRAFT_61404 [Bipolaris maydis ATCC 48331]